MTAVFYNRGLGFIIFVKVSTSFSLLQKMHACICKQTQKACFVASL